jgi:type IV secretory pathway TrbD component
MATESTRVMASANVPEYRSVYRSLHRPLTVCGVDRRLFFLALMVGVAAFNLFYGFLAGCLLFAGVYAFAWVSTARDPQMLQILLRSAQARRRYDAAKHDRVDIEFRR